jgi:menaquinone-dependent protoporphyrinogen oxidase
MRVLVGYASAYGSTKGIAKAIGDRLTKVGLQADVRPVDEVDAIKTYDAVVLGSAIHKTVWLPQAAVFIQSHSGDLAKRPVWLFSVGAVGETSSFLSSRVARFLRRLGTEPKQVTGFRQTIRPRGHRSFAGAIERAHWNLLGHLVLKAFGGSYGDHRDWRDIGTWADGIARQLGAT